MSQTLVSVITPTLNPGSRLQRCIESVRSQTYGAVEHIVVDGGSTDGTTDLLGAADVKWISEPDSGQSNAINKGFRMATGGVLGWLNADDVLCEDAIEKVVAEMTTDPAVGWTYGRVRLVYPDRVEIDHPDRVDRPLRWAAGNLAAQPGSFFADWALHRVGLLDESFHYMMDFELWLRLIDAGIKGAYIPDVLATFEVHEESKSGSVPHSKFIAEEARARLRTGRLRSGAVALGRLAAWRTSETGEVSLEFEISNAIEIARSEEVNVPMDLVDAAARLELAILRVKKRGLSALPRLLAPSVWRHAETRYRVLKVTGREARRIGRRARSKARPGRG